MLKPLRLESSISKIEVTGEDQISGREVAWSDESKMGPGRSDREHRLCVSWRLGESRGRYCL